MIVLLLFGALGAVVSIDGVLEKQRRIANDGFKTDFPNYYYRDLQAKLFEMTSNNGCTFDIGADSNHTNIDFQIRVVPPPRAVTKLWGSEGREIYCVPKLYSRTSDVLCTSRAFQNYVSGGMLFAKDCLKSTRMNSTVQRVNVVKRHLTTLHPGHVRCNIDKTFSRSMLASNQSLELPMELRSLNSYPFLIKSQNAIISRSGSLALSCGTLSLLASCEAVRYGISHTSNIINKTKGCRNIQTKSGGIGGNHCPFITYDRVFVVTQYEDANTVNFFLEVIPKVVYHLEFLLDNPDIKIHYGFKKRDTAFPEYQNNVPQKIFDWLGLGDRLITGLVHAKEAYLPREGGCQDVGYNAWEIVTARETYLYMANLTENRNNAQKSILVIESSLTMFVSASNDLARDYLSKDLLRDLSEILYLYFPTHRLEIIVDIDGDLMQCRECQIKKFQDADIVIGLHGGSLTNTMFMKSGGLVVEIFADYNPRHTPLYGTFSRLSGIIGLHHYSYFAPPDLHSLVATSIAEATLDFALDVGIVV